VSRLSASRETTTTIEVAERPSSGPRFLPRTFDAFQDREFAWYYTAMLGQMAAMNMQMIVLGLLVYDWQAPMPTSVCWG